MFADGSAWAPSGMWLVRHRVDVNTAASSKARRFVSGSMRRWSGSDRIEDVLLLTSELVTNAVDYGTAPVTLDICYDDAALRIEVHDAGNQLPQVGPAANQTADGVRGLAIVAALADEWGGDARSFGQVGLVPRPRDGSTPIGRVVGVRPADGTRRCALIAGSSKWTFEAHACEGVSRRRKCVAS